MIHLLFALAALSQVSVDDEASQIRRYLSTVGTELTSSDLDKLEAVAKEIRATVDRISKQKRDAETKRLHTDYQKWVAENHPELPPTEIGVVWYPHFDIWLGKNRRRYPELWSELNRFWRNKSK